MSNKNEHNLLYSNCNLHSNKVININNNNTKFNENIYINDVRNEHNISNEPFEETYNNIPKINIPSLIYRFKFTEEFTTHLYIFAKIHQYDDRKVFKEAWKVWIEENDDIIDEEVRRLENLNYNGDILDKMFKSVRYYFRNKTTEKKEPTQRRIYISVSRELLDKMDRHILENINNTDYQPKTGFIMFCKDNEDLIKQTITVLFNTGIRDSKIIEDKIKKTYKNRYFTITNNK
jgi:hypothetical protein